MEGYRVLENGDLRVSESGVSRSTEGFNEGEVSLSAVGSKVTASAFGAIGNFYGEGVGTLVTVGQVIRKGSNTLLGEASLEATGIHAQQGYSDLVGVGSQAGQGNAVRAAVGALEGISVLAPTGLRIKYGFSAISGVGSVASEAKRIRSADYTGFNEEAIRLTSSGDVRVTEDGNTRATNPLIYNQAEGTLVGASDKTQFNAEAYVKQSGVWKRMIPNAKHEGVWKEAMKMYKKINENWKRIY